MITSISQLDTTKTYTYADYLMWQVSERLELLKGYIRQMSAPNRRHQGISWNLSREFATHLKNAPCRAYSAPFDVRLVKNPQGKTNKEIYTVVQPDICIICDLSKLDDRGCIGAPELIVEIVSPTNSRTDVKDKFELYQECGVLEYWIVRPEEKSIEQLCLVDGKYHINRYYTDEDHISPTIFPELSIDLKEVFED